jgi:2-polyprenyl-6-methoxyphenol hydroxylase-like FAD-dependent oxidoreductase
MATTQTDGDKPKTGIKVIIIGAGTLPTRLLAKAHLANHHLAIGFGGLTAAIECVRQGHTPVIYESFPSLKILGDIITFGPNAGRIFYRWANGSVAASMRKISIDLRNYGFNIHKYDTGEIVINQKNPPRDETSPMFNGHRGELHEIVFEYAKSIGVTINLGQRVEKYWENEDKAGIELEDGTKVEGDLVVGSDGVRSKARTLVLGYEDKPKSSGYAVWRAWFPNKDMMADPETKQFCENGDTFNGWIGMLISQTPREMLMVPRPGCSLPLLHTQGRFRLLLGPYAPRRTRHR